MLGSELDNALACRAGNDFLSSDINRSIRLSLSKREVVLYEMKMSVKNMYTYC